MFWQSKVAEQICQTVPSDYATSLNIVYFPQLGMSGPRESNNTDPRVAGFLICVPMRDEWKTDAGIQVIDGWSFQVTTGYIHGESLTQSLLAVFFRV